MVTEEKGIEKQPNTPEATTVSSVSDGTVNWAVLPTDVTVTDADVVINTPGVIIRQPRIVCIAGFADTSRDLVNHEPDTSEIWSLNRCYTFLKRWDRWYELHESELYTGKTGLREDGYMEMLQKTTTPIYMQHPEPTFPTAVQFPLQEIIAEFRDYFTTSIAYMLAHAAYEHKVLGLTIDEIHLSGIDMSAFSEYSEQLPSVTFWIGICEGAGIKVTIPSVSPVLKSAMSYGRHSERPMQKMAKERLGYHNSQQASVSAELNSASGRSDEHKVIEKYLSDCTTITGEDWNENPIYSLNLSGFKEMMKKRVKEVRQYESQKNADLNATMGQIREAQHWIVALNAAQTVDEEPMAVKLAIGK